MAEKPKPKDKPKAAEMVVLPDKAPRQGVSRWRNKHPRKS